jgi:hypothetical protein
MALSRIHAEENHRWTPVLRSSTAEGGLRRVDSTAEGGQMNTDSEGWIPVLLPLALGHRPVNGVPP